MALFFEEPILLRMYRDRRFSDVTFVVEGKHVQAHRNILAENCVYFESMLYGYFNEAQSATIELKETPAKQFEEIIRFCYLREIAIETWTIEEISALLLLAHEYSFEPLIDHLLEIVISRHVNALTINDLYVLACKLELNLLKKACLDYAEDNISVVIQPDRFSNYSLEFVVALIQRDKFKKYGDYPVLKSVWCWKSNHTEEEAKQVFKKIEWSKLSPASIQSLIAKLIDCVDLGPLPYLSFLEQTNEPRKRLANAMKPFKSPVKRPLSEEDEKSEVVILRSRTCGFFPPRSSRR